MINVMNEYDGAAAAECVLERMYAGDASVEVIRMGNQLVALLALDNQALGVCALGAWDEEAFLNRCRILTARAVGRWELSPEFACLLGVSIGWCNVAFREALERVAVSDLLRLGAKVRRKLRDEGRRMKDEGGQAEPAYFLQIGGLMISCTAEEYAKGKLGGGAA